MSAITVTGTLRRDARCFVDALGRSYIAVDLMLPAAEFETVVHAVKPVGSGPAAQYAASATCSGYRKGTRVTVHAQRFVCGFRSLAEITLRDVDRIEPVDRPTDHFTPER